MEHTSPEITARRFLKSGIFSNISENDLALACDRLIQKTAGKSLKEALRLAENFAEFSRRYSLVLRLTGLRALARIRHMSGIHKEALKAYLSARKLCSREPLTRARIDRALVDVYMYRGDFENGQNAAKRAINTFRRMKSQSDLVQTQVNYANLLHRQDRHREAEKLYHQAALYFEKNGNELACARCYYNRANTLVQLFDISEAEIFYGKAFIIYTREGFDLDATDARYGLAWLLMLTGKYHKALLELAECESAYAAGGDPRGQALCILDRAEVYLGLGLYSDALQSATACEKRFTGLNLRYEKSKASFFRAHAAAALGRKQIAVTSLNRAMAGFQKESNRGFLGAVHVLEADLFRDNKDKNNKALKTARTFFSRAQLPYWQALCDLYQASTAADSKNAMKRLSGNKAVRAVPQLYALWQTLEGDIYQKKGDVEKARKCWQAAADRLDLVRAQLPPLELRNAFNRKQSLPHTRLIASMADDNPPLAAAWSERFKTAGLWTPLASFDGKHSARNRIGKILQELAGQVALIVRQIEGTGGERSLSSQSSQKTLKLQKQVRDELISLERYPDAGVDSPERIIREANRFSGKMPIVQFYMDDLDIYAFVNHRSQTRMHVYKNGRMILNKALQRWRFIMESELLSPALKRLEGAYGEETLWRELGEWLWPPLEIGADSKRVLIIPEGEMSNLPWQALIVNGRVLVEKHQFILNPSLRHYRKSVGIRSGSDKVGVFVGPGDDLGQIGEEALAVKNFAGTNAEIFNPCNRKDWPSNGEGRLWHFAGHAELSRENPFYSFLKLADGPLFAADFRLRDCRIDLVVLAACRSGEQVAMPGEESTGLVRSLLEMGARNVIAGHWPIADKPTSLWMKSFYKKYFSNENLLDAVSYASDTVRELYPSAYHWAAFSVSGAGDTGGIYE